MTNLKKVLSLALVFALALGLMISAAAVDLSDWDDIENQDAVELLAALSIMGGHADGTFDPQGFLTRAEVAKMIYVARRGVDDKAVLYQGISNSTFTDVPATHWAKGYINYAAAMGFVSGDGKGSFRPDASITGFEVFKIALTALGYDAEREGFVGSMWQANVIAAAMDAGLTEGYEGNPASPITRDEAANIFSKLIYAQIVKYDDGILTPIYSSTNDPVLFSEKYLSLNEVSGIVTANEYADLNNAAALAAGKTKIGTAIYPISTPAELLGQKISILVKGTPADTTKATIYGSAIVSPLNTVVKADSSGTALTTALRAAGIGTNLSAVSTYLNGIATTALAATPTVAVGQSVTVVDNNGDKTADFVFIDEYRFGKVTAYTAATATANGTLTISSSDNGYVPFSATAAPTSGAKKVVGFENVAKNDYVLYRVYGDKLYVQKAVSFTGTLSSKSSDSLTLGIGGVSYKVSQNTNTSGLTAAGSASFMVEYTFYQDILGNVIALAPVSGPVATTYAWVVDYEFDAADFDNGYKDSAKALMILDDGTQGVYNIKTVDGSAVLPTSNTAMDGSIVKYIALDDGSMALTKIAANVYNDDVKIENGKTLIANTYYANDATIFLFVSGVPGSTLKAVRYVGKNTVPTFDGTADSTADETFLAFDNTTSKTAKFVVIKSAAPSIATYSYAYVVSTNYTQTLEGYTYNVVIDGQATTLLASAGTGVTAGEIYNIVKNDKGQAELTSGNIAANVVKGDYVNYVATDVLVVRDSGSTYVKEYSISASTYVYITEAPAGQVDKVLGAGDQITYILGPNNSVTHIFITDDN